MGKSSIGSIRPTNLATADRGDNAHMAYKLGMPTLMELNTLEDNARLCAELHLRFVEINMNLPAFQAHRLQSDRLNELASRYDIAFTLHLDENLNPFDFNPLVAQAYRETALRAIRLAAEAHIEIINLHMPSGVYFTLPEERVYLFDRYPDEYLHAVQTFGSLCAKAGANENVYLCIENTGGFTAAQRAGIGALLTWPCFRLTYDIGHAHACENKDEQFYDKNAEKLCHMHIHDATGRADHLPPGEGEIDIIRWMCRAKAQNLSCVLETKTISGLRMAAQWMHKHSF